MNVLAISGSLRDASNSTALLRALREEAPEGVEVILWDGLKSIPPYDQDDDIVPAPAAAAAQEIAARVGSSSDANVGDSDLEVGGRIAPTR